MRNVIVSNIVSVDGFYAAADGNPVVLNMDEAFDAYNRERIEAADTVLLGRSSFEGFSSYWPHVADAPAEPGNRALSEDNRRTSHAYNSIAKVVVSDALHIPSENPWQHTTSIIGREDAADWIKTSRNDGDGDILIFASRVMWNGLLAQGLIDEIHLMVSPTALTKGIPVFTTPASLSLLNSRRFENSDNVLLRYTPRY